MKQSHIDNKRIAKNTVFLYFRTLFVLIVSLYTSRVILEILGVDDYGIYQVVGGMVAIFSILSGALATAISRYLTYELGTGNLERLRRIFSTSIIIQIVLALIVLVAAEILSVWFIEHKMTVPENQLTATKWVLQFTLITFCVTLISVPYNAVIIAHERMKAFAYISILEVSLKLGICYLLLISPVSRLVAYAFLLMVVSVIIRFIYSLYCHRHFEECSGRLSFDGMLFKEMLSFSGWSFFNNSAYILNNQGVTMLVNVFFGLSVNAARGLATQVENAVLQFVNNFTIAVNPQITKSYAAGEMEGMYTLICRGAKFSYFAMLILALPLFLEMRRVLGIWLGDVPEYTVIFAQLSLIMGMCDCIGITGYTACMATGRLRTYALVITPIGCLEFVLTWIMFAYGAPVVSTYYLFIGVKTLVLIARMFLLKKMVGLSIKMYINQVFIPIIITTFLASILPVFIYVLLSPSILRFILVISVAMLSVSVTIYWVGISKVERSVIKERIIKKLPI